MELLSLRNFIVTFIAIFFVTINPALSQNYAPIPDRKIRIGFVAHSIDLYALFGQLREGFRDHLDLNNVQYEFFQGAPDTSSSHDQMVKILKDMARLQLDYLLVGPTSLKLNQPGLEAIANSGTKLLMTDYQRPQAGVPYDYAVLNWVVYSHDEMGFKAGQWLGKKFKSLGKNKAKIIILWGPVDSEISTDRGQGALRGLYGYDNLEIDIVYEAYADFERQKAYEETLYALENYKFDAILALNSYMSVSARNAIVDQNKSKQIIIAGMGGSIGELKAVADGEIGVVPFRDPNSMGKASADALIKHLTGAKDQIVKTIYSDIPVLDNAESIRLHVPRKVFDVDTYLAR